jgi:nucleoside-diphosphate-sugar epimerase
MRVFVTGGTGAIGSHAIPAFSPKSNMVTALARTSEKAAALSSLPARQQRQIPDRDRLGAPTPERTGRLAGHEPQQRADQQRTVPGLAQVGRPRGDPRRRIRPSDYG